MSQAYLFPPISLLPINLGLIHYVGSQGVLDPTSHVLSRMYKPVMLEHQNSPRLGLNIHFSRFTTIIVLPIGITPGMPELAEESCRAAFEWVGWPRFVQVQMQRKDGSLHAIGLWDDVRSVYMSCSLSSAILREKSSQQHSPPRRAVEMSRGNIRLK